MPPRQPGTGPTAKKSSAFKAVDDFLEKSSAAPGEVLGSQAQEQLAAHNKQIKDKYFEQFSVGAIQQNMQQLEKCRTQTLLFGGMTAGIFGLDGMQGMLFYIALVAFVSLVVALRLGFSPRPYFVNLAQATTSGMFSNVLTYMLMWVMFHNLVYVL